MKQLTKPKKVTAKNGLGGYSTTMHTEFEVEATDVGSTRDNFLGYRHRSYQFQRSDVGRHIQVQTDGTGWTCWYFVLPG